MHTSHILGQMLLIKPQHCKRQVPADSILHLSLLLWLGEYTSANLVVIGRVWQPLFLYVAIWLALLAMPAAACV